MSNDDDIDKFLKDRKGNYFSLEIGPDTEGMSNENYVPYDPEYPDACRYLVYSYATSEGIIFEDLELMERVVKKLKSFHGIKDPWDDDPNYFKKRKEPRQ